MKNQEPDTATQKYVLITEGKNYTVCHLRQATATSLRRQKGCDLIPWENFRKRGLDKL
jgi:hypothetical protein